jgi:hypothetical protein
MNYGLYDPCRLYELFTDPRNVAQYAGPVRILEVKPLTEAQQICSLHAAKGNYLIVCA